MTSFSFSGHETFSLRHGWLKKGVDGAAREPHLFSEDDAMIRLGVGRNMVQSIRHWCAATRVLEDSKTRGEVVPSELGKRIFSHFDPYLEDSATLWLLHWNLANNSSASTTWFWMFNHYTQAEFDKEKIISEIQSWLKKEAFKKPVSENTLKRDVDCFLRTYVASRQTKPTVSEDSLDCPLADLHLITELDDGKTYRFNRGSHDSLPDEIFTLALAEFWDMKERPESVALTKMMSEAGSPARVFKLDEDSIVQRLERAETISNGALAYDETAGLKQIYRHGAVDAMKLLENFYLRKTKRAGAER